MSTMSTMRTMRNGIRRVSKLSCVALVAATALACQGRLLPMTAQVGSTVLIPLGDPDVADLAYGGTAVGTDYQRGTLVFRLTDGYGGSVIMDGGSPVELTTRLTTVVTPSPRAAGGGGLGTTGRAQVVAIVDIPASVQPDRYGLQVVRKTEQSTEVVLPTDTFRSELEILPASIESPPSSGNYVAGQSTPFEGWGGTSWLTASQSDLDQTIPRPAIHLFLDRSCDAPPCSTTRRFSTAEFELTYPSGTIDVADAVAPAGDRTTVWLDDNGTGTVKVGLADPNGDLSAVDLVFTLDDGSTAILDLANVSVTLLGATDQDGVDLSDEWTVSVTASSIR